MKHLTIILIVGLFTLTACNQKPATSPALAKSENTSGQVNPKDQNSIYQLAGTWTNQDKKTMALNDLRGKVQVLAMVFTHCQAACPRITSDIKTIESQIATGKLDKVGFVLVSFDAERDTASQLKFFYNKMNLDEHWNLLHGNEEQIRALSVLLNVSYKKGQDGIYAHSNIITVLDTSGNIQFQQEGLGADTKEILSNINNLVNSF